MSEWKALSARITLFPISPPSSGPLSAVDLYRQVWRGEPDSFQKEQSALLPMVAQGKQNGITIGCFSHPARIDFNLSPAVVPTSELSLALIDDTRQLYAELIGIIDALAVGTVSIPASRVAFAAQFITLKPSLQETNQTLTRIMPDQYRIKLSDEDDLIFQINRPRPSSKVEGIRMNFITKWSIERLQVIGLAIPSSGVPIAASREIPSPPSAVKSFIAASVSLDNNNVPGPSLNNTQQAALLLEGLSEAGATLRQLGLKVDGF
jgi:hypothetical protein